MTIGWRSAALAVACLTVICAGCPRKPIKYTVDTLGNFSYDREIFESDVVRVESEVLRVTLSEDVPTICKGSLMVTGETLHFLAHNRGIEEIESGAFEDQAIRLKLELYNNSLTIIRKGTFKNMPVNELNLSSNKIATIDRGAFEDLPNMYLLHLNNNKIKTFYPSSLLNTPHMLILDMSHNCLETLEENSFLFMTKLKKVGIDLSFNKLKKVHPKAFDGISVYTVDLKNNSLAEEESFYKKNYVVFE